ncbi:9f61d75e-31a6-4fba-9b4e-7dcf47082789 [Sclerotinia trifoliorum]|uniref:9f61d75e-31a6-4fba-9b4e-7dcf47082789 n=1 Tax=Sclerotinia trifoliorum TaxID=28548 RepID=A0A8H2ZTF1_9HELO|nr:9f61d75e-31a6-4fba-9b4e-7dcf47082789 [Sclerotinia trifoliorum]
MIQARLIYWIGAVVPLCWGQETGWILDQVNTTMCYWTSPRAAVVRDTFYLDGGELWWEPGLSDGSYAPPVSDGNPLGLVYLLNFNTSFHISDNVSTIFSTISKAPNGGSASNLGPNYVDGAMFANDYEWYTYGGMLVMTAAFSSPDEDSAISYEVYTDGTPGKQFFQNFQQIKLPTNLTRYVTYGGAVSIPSENLGYYFSGYRAADFGDIYNDPGIKNASYLANVTSQTLISVDMTIQTLSKWSNESLPSSVPGRANPEIAWIPVSEQGILVAVGGVIDPTYASISQANNASVNAQSSRISPGFMTTVSIYDISKKVWYEQETSGSSPGALTQGCTVVASAEDGSSHNIYWYGGYDGIHITQPFSDDVYVLSIPSFIWTKVYTGNSTHGRAGHKCAKPYPDQMVVVGGYASLSGNIPTCLEGGMIQIFNLSDPQWLNSYDPLVWSNYTVPSQVTSVIGGSGTGSATQTTPSGGFANSSMTELLGTSYNTTKITNWYPYTPASSTPTNNRTTLLPSPVATKSGTPAYLGPVLGVVLGLFFITLLILAFIIYRRRKIFGLSRSERQSEVGTMTENRRRTLRWLYATPRDAKAPTVTTDETELNAVSSEADTDYTRVFAEMPGDTQFHEMDDTSRPSELHNTGFVFTSPKSNVWNNISSIQTPITHSPSASSNRSHASTVSRTSGPRPSPISPARADSLTFNEQAGGMATDRVHSDLSSVAESDRGHLRQISDTSVSVDGDYGNPPMLDVQIEGPNDDEHTFDDEFGRPGVVSPLTPPQGVGEGRHHYFGPDSVGVGSMHNAQPVDTRRKSNFEEKLDDE